MVRKDKVINIEYTQLDLEWKRTTFNANIAFKAGFLLYANCLYENAVAQAKHLLKNLACSKDSVSVVLVSLHNLADFHLQNNNRRDALDCLQEAVLCLSDKLKANSLSSRSEVALLWGLSRANRQLWLLEKSQKPLIDC